MKRKKNRTNKIDRDYEMDMRTEEELKEISRLQKLAKEAQPKDRYAIFKKLEEITGGGIETKVTEGNTRFIRTKYDE